MNEHTLLWTAIHALKIDVPVMRYEIAGAGTPSPSITLYLYGGQVLTYSPRPSGAGWGKDQPAGKKKINAD
jgi:hypothetical protein